MVPACAVATTTATPATRAGEILEEADLSLQLARRGEYGSIKRRDLRELEAAHALYGEVRQALESGHPRVLELTCEKDPHKRVSLLSGEILAVQTYEKSAVGGGGRRPGFSFEG